MKRRWAAFHGDMRRMSGKWWQRVLGQLLGEDTLRYRVARRLGRPLLQFLRRLRASQHNEPTKATAQFAGAPLADGDSEVFPINYSPKTSIRFINLASYEVSTEDVTTGRHRRTTGGVGRHRRGQSGARGNDGLLDLPVRHHE